MSSNNDYGYGKDIRLEFKTDSEIDLSISSTGDIDIVGGGSGATFHVKAENVIQQIKLRLFTPYKTLKDENGNDVNFGSLINDKIGSKVTSLMIGILKSYVISALADIQAIQSIVDIIINYDPVVDKQKLNIGIKFKIKDDNKIYFTTVLL